MLIFSEKSSNRTLQITWQIQTIITCTDTEIKVKINLSLSLKSQHYTMNIYWKMQLLVYTFLTLTLGGDEGSPSYPNHLTPEEGVPSIH